MFHNEVTTKQFMEEVHDLLKNSTDIKVKDEILRIIQAWAHAFRNEPAYRAVHDQMRIMKAEGYKFPVFKESDAMFSASNAPEWTDGECCHRCRALFTMIARKHHCRHCGQVFCSSCSAKTSTIPKFGIEKEVRVCDVCFDKINKKPEHKPPAEESKPKPPPVNKKTEQEIQEEEELQLALALSKSEAEKKEMERMNYGSMSLRHSMNNHYSNTNNNNSSNNSSSKHKTGKSKNRNKNKAPKAEVPNENEDPDMARYLNREYWQQRVNLNDEYENAPSPSAPQPTVTSLPKSGADNVENKILKEKNQNASTKQSELETFTETLNSTIEIFLNRLNSNKLRGRAIANDNGVQSLFLNLTNMHSQLIMYMQQTDEARTNCERLQDKINQIRDARAALDALREDYRDQMRRAAEEAERIRQQQMAQKLEIMRQKKHEYLQYQREVALQRMQEQERELMMRSEQLKYAAANTNSPVSSQWSAVPGSYMPPTSTIAGQHNYYMTSYPQSQAMVTPQSIINGQYVQAPLPNASNMVAAHTAPMSSPVVPTIPTHMQQPQQQPMGHMQGMPPPQYMSQMPAMYMPQGYAQDTPQMAQYMIAQQQLPQMAQPPPPPDESVPPEELLIKFD